MRTINTVGVVGAGTMGSALAQKFAQEGLKVILADRTINFVEKGLNNIKQMLNEGVERKVFTQNQIDIYLENLRGTSNLNDLKECDLIIEAIFENFDAKIDLFKSLSAIVPPTTIIATNTSSFSVTELSKNITYPERFVGLHFFYHAAKNRLVEIIPGEKTSPETFEAMKRFSVLAGKDAITCSDAYGFVVNRFFVPWLNEATRLFDEGIASKEDIDRICMKTFGIGMGPFALMNATGVPVAYHAEKTLEIFGNLYTTSDRLKKQAETGKPWEINMGQQIAVDKQAEQLINDRMLGVIFFISTQLLDETVCTATDINRGAKIGLRWKKGPIDLMVALGVDEVNRLVLQVANIYQMVYPKSVGIKFWKTVNVKLETRKEVAIITMDQPENLNALSVDTMKQLSDCIDEANNNKEIDTIFLVGTGKAFVAGADIKFFIKNIKSDRICDIETFTEFGQKVFDRIDHSAKKVVAVINGLALGGGLELALCADVIFALPKAKIAFPETGIGIYPGLGGTQRSSKKIGKGLSKFLIHTGNLLSAADAFEIGLVDEVIDYDDLYQLLDGKKQVKNYPNKILNKNWKSIKEFFETNSINQILDGTFSSGPSLDSEKLVKTIKYKAPIAIKVADKLISEAKGCKSELEHLREIFSTSDALLGLTSIGQRVEYMGR